MRAKKYLGRFAWYEDKIQRKLAEVYRNRVLAENVSVAFGQDRVQTSGSGDRIATFVAAIVDSEQDVADLLQEFRDFSRVALSQLEGLCLLGDSGMAQYKVLHARFVERQIFEDIAESLNYSERQVYNIYKEGLKLFEELYLLEESG